MRKKTSLFLNREPKQRKAKYNIRNWKKKKKKTSLFLNGDPK